MKRCNLNLILAGLVSAALHAALLWYAPARRRRPAPERAASVGRVHVRLSASPAASAPRTAPLPEKPPTAKKTEPEPPPKPIKKRPPQAKQEEVRKPLNPKKVKKIERKPVRISSDAPKSAPERSGSAAPPPKPKTTAAPPPSPKRPAAPAAKAEGNTAHKADAARSSRFAATRRKPFSSKTPPEPKEKAEPLTRVVEQLSKAAKNDIRSTISETEYRYFLQKARIGRVRGMSAPQLVLAWQDVKEILDLHRYFGIQLLALDPAAPRTVVQIVGLPEADASFQKIERFDWNAYSNRVFRRPEPFFADLLARIVRQGLVPDTAAVFSVLPNRVDLYFRWKQIEVLRRNGLDPKNVAVTVGRFLHTNFGAWIMAIEKVQTRDGRFRDVTDFEVEKLRGE